MRDSAAASGSGRNATYFLVFALTAANGVWIFLDNSTPSWDQSHYMDVAWQYQRALDRHGIYGLVHALYSVDTAHAPLYSLLVLPFLYVFGDGPRSALLLDLAITPLFLAVTGLISLELFANRRAQQLTIVAAATMPLLVGLSHEILQDFLLLTLTTTAVWLILRSDFFRRRTTMALLGVTIGLGMLTKVTSPVFIGGPLLVAGVARIYLVLRTERGWSSVRGLMTLLIDLATAALPALVIAAAWYGPNWGATLAYIRSTTSGALAAGAGPADPLTVRAIASFTIGMLDWNLSLAIALILLIAALCCAPRAVATLRERGRSGRNVFVASFLVSWFALPYLSVALSHNQDVRLMASALPAVAVAVGGAITAIPWQAVRMVLGTLLVCAGIFQTAVASSALSTRAPVDLTLQTAVGALVLPVLGEPLGYEDEPMPDYGTPIVRTIAQESQGRSGLLCLLESDPIVNPNTLLYLVNENNLPLTVTQLFGATGQESSLARQLKRCSFALYVRQPGLGNDAAARISIVNSNVAADYMTPALVGLFKGPPHTFSVGGDQQVQLLTMSGGSLTR